MKRTPGIAQIAAAIIRDMVDLGPAVTLAGLGRHLSGDPIVLQLADIGPILIRRGDSDFHMVRQVFRDRMYEIANAAVSERVNARYRDILSRGRMPVIVDAGANIGSATLWFKHQYPDAAIVAIEPDPGSYALLARNIAGRSNVVALQAAIGSQAGHVILHKGDTSCMTTTERADAGCPLMTIPQAAAQFANGELLIVKIDIEGFEEDLFADNLDWVDEAFAVFVEPHDWRFADRYTSRNFQRVFAARERQLLINGENLLYVKLG